MMSRVMLSVACFGVVVAAVPVTPPTDLIRARAKVPRSAYRAPADRLAQRLNEHLVGGFPLAIPCERWSVSELQALQERIWKARSPVLAEIYESSNDRRHVESPQTLWALATAEAAIAGPRAQLLQQQAHCREAVMWLVHHLDDLNQQIFRETAVPMLPVGKPALCPRTATPSLCRHHLMSHVCSDCHLGEEETPYVPVVPSEGEQPEWPAELPDPITMTVHNYKFATPEPVLVDAFHVDYRFLHGQQYFKHNLRHAGCEVLIEGNDPQRPTNIWVWATQANGTTTCIKGFTNLTLVSTNFVRRALIPFSKAGRKNISVPNQGVVDTWAWCRLDGAECFYESVAPRAYASWQFRQAHQLPNESTLEYYSDIATHEDTGPFELPVECPDLDAPPLFDSNTYPNLGKVCNFVLEPDDVLTTIV